MMGGSDDVWWSGIEDARHVGARRFQGGVFKF